MLTLGMAGLLALAFCMAVRSVIKRISSIQSTLVKLLLAEGRFFTIVSETERRLAQCYQDHAMYIEGWAESGRLSRAVADAKDAYRADRQQILHESELALRELGNEIQEFSPDWLSSLVHQYPDQFPSLGLIRLAGN